MRQFLPRWSARAFALTPRLRHSHSDWESSPRGTDLPARKPPAHPPRMPEPSLSPLSHIRLKMFFMRYTRPYMQFCACPTAAVTARGRASRGHLVYQPATRATGNPVRLRRLKFQLGYLLHGNAQSRILWASEAGGVGSFGNQGPRKPFRGIPAGRATIVGPTPLPAVGGDSGGPLRVLRQPQSAREGMFPCWLPMSASRVRI